jgi:hypothetical protein
MPAIIHAQIWVARYNGPYSLWDMAHAIAVDDTGNVYVTGISRGMGTYYDYATVKYDSSGVEQWVARYNGSLNSSDGANAIAIDGTGNVYVTGYSHEGSGIADDYATIKYDASGVEQWVALYDGPGHWVDCAQAIVVDDAGCVYVTGKSVGSGTAYDYATIKYDSLGIEQWVARYNGPPGNDADLANAIAIDDEANIYVTGRSRGLGTEYDYATVKYDSSGVEQWVARYNGSGNHIDGAKAIALWGVGNIYVTGYSHGTDTDRDYATIKYDSSGVEQWIARYNGPGNNYDYANAIAVDDSGNVCITGGSVGYGTALDFATIKYNSSGVEQWVARYNGSGYNYDDAAGIAIDFVGNIYVTGPSDGSTTHTDYATVKYDPTGMEQWVARYDGPTNYDDYSFAIAVHNGGSVYVTGRSEGVGTDQDYATIKYSPTGLMENKNTNVKKESLMTTIFRSPLQLPEGKKCKVFDITGSIVEPDKIQPGIYFVEIDGVVTQKVVKIR